MMLFRRRRLFFWLVKAYVKRWGKQIFLAFVLGLIFFFLLLWISRYAADKNPFLEQERIGIAGLYDTENLPDDAIKKMSMGLTKLSEAGIPEPGVAKEWEIKNDGKTYIFTLKDNLHFSDGTKVTSSQIKYNFLNVDIERPDDKTIIFKLKESYSPFLVTTSRPIFKKGLVGIGEYKVKNIDLNGNFLDSLTLVSNKNKFKTAHYQVYPTEEALKTAFILGEVNSIQGLQSTEVNGDDFRNFKNVEIVKDVNYSKMVALFYNTQDPILSEKKLRTGLSYSVPDSLSYGLRNSTPYSPLFWANSALDGFVQDLDHSKNLISQSESATKGGELSFKLKTLPKYANFAYDLKEVWKKIGVNVEIEEVEEKPTNFQMLISDFNIPKDPDQYTLWHSAQGENNITKYKSLRIDKLLEDGRKISEIDKRQKIYSDFQKYLLDDSPATFLYFPYTYEIKRK